MGIIPRQVVPRMGLISGLRVAINPQGALGRIIGYEEVEKPGDATHWRARSGRTPLIRRDVLCYPS